MMLELSPTDGPSIRAVIDRTRSGTLIFNDTIQQLSGKRIPSLSSRSLLLTVGPTVNEIPFTGIGESGRTFFPARSTCRFSLLTRDVYIYTEGYQILKYTYDGFTHLRASINIPAE